MFRSGFRVYGVGYRFRICGLGLVIGISSYAGLKFVCGTGSGSSLGLGLRLYALGFMSALSKEAEIGDPCL